jgi:predicted acetyltransferase
MIRVVGREILDNAIEVRIPGGRDEQQDFEDCIAADIGALTQMIMGYVSASTLNLVGRLKVSSPHVIEIADALFPPADIFLGFADRF